MRRTSMLLMAALVALLVAAPALAQPDPYGEVRPGDTEPPGGGVVAPDTQPAPAPGARVDRPAPTRGDMVRDNPVRWGVAADRVVVAGRQLPVTGVDLAAGLLLALALIGGGTVAVGYARRRGAIT